MGKQTNSSVSINLSLCTPCRGLICVGVCPQGVLQEGKNKKPEAQSDVPCTKCGVCVTLCPAKAITINPSKPQK